MTRLTEEQRTHYQTIKEKELAKGWVSARPVPTAFCCVRGVSTPSECICGALSRAFRGFLLTLGVKASQLTMAGTNVPLGTDALSALAEAQELQPIRLSPDSLRHA